MLLTLTTTTSRRPTSASYCTSIPTDIRSFRCLSAWRMLFLSGGERLALHGGPGARRRSGRAGARSARRRGRWRAARSKTATIGLTRSRRFSASRLGGYWVGACRPFGASTGTGRTGDSAASRLTPLGGSAAASISPNYCSNHSAMHFPQRRSASDRIGTRR